MFEAIVNRAQRSVETVVLKYVARAAVALPFIIALGFGTASAAVKLSEDFGTMTAYGILAASFAGIGLAASAAIAVSAPTPVSVVKGAEPPTAISEIENASTSTLPDTEVLLAALGTLGPTAIPGLARLLVRHLPLIVGLIVIAYLLLSSSKQPDVAPASTDM